MRTLALAVVASAVLSTQVQAGLLLFSGSSKACAPAPACKPAPAPVCKAAPACARPCPIKASLKLPKLCLPKIDLLSLFRCNNGGGGLHEEELPESDLGEAEGDLAPSAADAAPAPKDAPAPPKEAPAPPEATPAPPKDAPAPPKESTKAATAAKKKAPYVEKAAPATPAAPPKEGA